MMGGEVGVEVEVEVEEGYIVHIEGREAPDFVYVENAERNDLGALFLGFRPTRIICQFDH